MTVVGRDVRDVLELSFHCHLGGICQSGKDKSGELFPQVKQAYLSRKMPKKMIEDGQKQVRDWWRLVTSAEEL